MFSTLTMTEQTELYTILCDGHRQLYRLMDFMIPADVNARVWRSVADTDYELLDLLDELADTPFADSRP